MALAEAKQGDKRFFETHVYEDEDLFNVYENSDDEGKFGFIEDQGREKGI